MIVDQKSKQRYHTLSLQRQVSVTVVCIFGFPYYSSEVNIIDELCMRAQVPLYSSGD